MSELKKSESDYRKAFKTIYSMLVSLINSSQLDVSTEARDCLTVFDEYKWEMKPGCDTWRFDQLIAKGNAGTMSFDELEELMDLVSDSGELHIFYFICKGKDALMEFGELYRTLE